MGLCLVHGGVGVTDDDGGVFAVSADAPDVRCGAMSHARLERAQLQGLVPASTVSTSKSLSEVEQPVDEELAEEQDDLGEVLQREAAELAQMAQFLA